MGPSILWVQDYGRSPFERKAASAGGSGSSEEPVTFLRMEGEQEPCWARDTKFTLSCSFKTTAGQGERAGASALGPRATAEEYWPTEEGSALPGERTQHKGTLPMAGTTTQPERYRGSCYEIAVLFFFSMVF